MRIVRGTRVRRIDNLQEEGVVRAQTHNSLFIECDWDGACRWLYAPHYEAVPMWEGL